MSIPISREPLSSKQSHWAGAAALISGLTFLSRLLGLMREQVFAYFFGAGPAADAFQIAFRIPNLLRDLFAEGAMSSALVPIYVRRRQVGEESAWHLVSRAATVLGLLGVGLALGGILFAGPLVRFYASEFENIPGKLELTISLTRVLWLFLPFVLLAALWMAVLNARDRYGFSSFASSAFNLVSILCAVLLCPFFIRTGYADPIYGMAIGVLLGGFAQWFIQVPSLRAEGYRFRFDADARDRGLREMVVLMGLGTFGLAATQINVLMNSLMASAEGPGAVSWLNYAFRFMQFPIGVFGVAIATATLTRVSKEAAVDDLKALRESVRVSMRMVIVLSLPSSVGLAAFGVPILSVIYQHGRFGSEDVYASAMALACYSLGLSAYSAIKVLVPIFYSLGKARVAVLWSAAAVAVNFFLSKALMASMGYKGLALATSLSAIANGAVLLLELQREIKQIDFKDLASCFLRSAASCLIMFFVLLGALYVVEIPFLGKVPLTSRWQHATFLAHFTVLSLALTAAVAVFAACAKWLGLHEFQQLTDTVWKRLKQCKERL